MSMLPGPEFRVPVEQHGLYGGTAWLVWVCKVIFTSNPTEAIYHFPIRILIIEPY